MKMATVDLSKFEYRFFLLSCSIGKYLRLITTSLTGSSYDLLLHEKRCCKPIDASFSSFSLTAVWIIILLVFFVRCCMMQFYFVQSYCSGHGNTPISPPLPPHRLYFAAFPSPARHLPRLRLLSPRTNWGGCCMDCRWMWSPRPTRGGTSTVAAKSSPCLAN